MLLRIADIHIEAPYELLEDAKRHYADYLAEGHSPDITVREDICEIGEQLPMHDRILTHGVAISCDGKGFIFTAPSGTGKSTHAFLWQQLLGEDRVTVINGDKPIISNDLTVYGTPWCGKEGLHRNIGVPLHGIGLLHRSTTPHMTRATQEEFMDFMLQQTFLPRNPLALKKTFALLELIYNKVPVYKIYADMSRECIEMSSSCFNG